VITTLLTVNTTPFKVNVEVLEVVKFNLILSALGLEDPFGNILSKAPFKIVVGSYEITTSLTVLDEPVRLKLVEPLVIGLTTAPHELEV
jgi:hypothetical protein